MIKKIMQEKETIMVVWWKLKLWSLRITVASTSQTCGQSRVRSSVRQHSFVEIGHEIISTAILFIPLIQVGQLSVTGERMCT